MFNNVKKDSCYFVLTKGAKRMYTYPMEAGYSLQVDQGADLISERRVTRESEDAEYGQIRN